MDRVCNIMLCKDEEDQRKQKLMAFVRMHINRPIVQSVFQSPSGELALISEMAHLLSKYFQ